MPLNCALAPCKSCPYRKDAPLRFWDIGHFRLLLLQHEDRDLDPLGRQYDCHQQNGQRCTGWVMNQDERREPEQHESVAFRIMRRNNNITNAELDTLRCPVPRYATVEQMCYTNYPELLDEEASTYRPNHNPRRIHALHRARMERDGGSDESGAA